MVLMVCLSTVLIIPSDLEVNATGGGGGGEEEDDIGLDFDWMWNVAIDNMSNAVYLAYNNTEIRKGREFGTKGELWAANKIKEYMIDNCGLENVDKLPLGPIKKLKFINRYYSGKVNVKDYLLNIDIDSENYDKDISQNECFVIPMTRTNNQLENLTGNFPYDDCYIKLDPADNNLVTNADAKWPLGGSFTNYSCFNLTIDPDNDFDILLGNATYIASGDPLPDDQENRVFLFDENKTTESDLDNVTNATGVLLIHEYNVIEKIDKEVTAKYNYSICRVETDEANLNAILNGLENESMVCDNIFDNTTLTFTNNISQACVPLSDYFILSTRGLGWGISANLSHKFDALRLWFLNIITFLDILSDCKGCITYKPCPTAELNKTHYMNNHAIGNLRGGWFRNGGSDSDDFYLMARVLAWPALPVFFVNYTLGNYLYENYDDALISGYVNQEFLQEKHLPLLDPSQWTAGATTYNVVGNLNIDKSDNIPDSDDPTVVISNRYDGWWCETPFDCGSGVGVVLAIAKYFNDSNITPKVNITFLETTGEEFMFRGAQHFSDSYPDRNYSLWIGFDQLAGNWTGKKFEITYNDKNIMAITENISILNGYPKTTNNNYSLEHNVTFEFTAAEEDVWKQRNLSMLKGGVGAKYGCKTICFCNEKLPFRHRRGEYKDKKFTAGDVMGIIDREDLNDSLVLAWDITKYFCVNPDCWLVNPSMNIVDSDDADTLVDTVRHDSSVISTLPHDIVMVNFSLIQTYGAANAVVKSEYMNFSINRSQTSKTINITLPADDPPGYYQTKIEFFNSTGRIDEIVSPANCGSTVNPHANVTYFSGPVFLYPYGYAKVTPTITNVSDSPDPVGFGYDVTISADVISEVNASIDAVSVNVTYPDDSYLSFNMSNTEGDTYEYVFNDTWQNGEYEYGIWAVDVNGNESGSPIESFNVSAQATMSVCTIKNGYGDNEMVNLTDPPVAQIGYEFLDDGDVLRIWNKYDSYYFDTDNGIQLTNHYNNYWTHNVLMLGYYNNDVWNLIYRTDELSGFNKNIEFDGWSFVNATLWKDLTYGGYDFRLAVRYQLGVDDNELTVIPYIKNIGEDSIPFDLGFAWEMKDIQVDMTQSGDYIEINGESYYLNQEDLDETYTNLAVPCFYIREDIMGSTSESLYLRWDENLNYVVSVKSRTGQYNAPVTLGIKVGTLGVGQEKYTELFWHDASETSFYFDAYLSGVEEWTTNPGNMVDGNTSNFASTPIVSDVELCINNTCNGSDLGTVSKVEIRAHGKYLGMYQRDIILRPVFYGMDGDNHVFVTTPSADWSQWFDITDDTNAPDWDWIRVRDLDCDVESGSSPPGTTVYCSKVEIRVTYNVNNPPGITAQYPLNGATGTGIAPLLTVSVYDPEGDNMTISWLSNSSGSWQVFGTNNSVGNGTYHQTMNNASVNGQWWYWKVNITDGSNYVESSVHKFYTGYESKIVNTGSTNFKGYLLMQVQFYNNSTWVVADDTINETSPRTMLWENPGGTPGQHIFGLDSVFNDLVNTSNLSGFGNGTYRVYAALRDPDGNVLKANSSSYIEATYEFTITFD